MYASNNLNGTSTTVPPTMAYPQYSDPNSFASPLSTVSTNPQISSHTNSKDPSMVKARVFVGNLNTFRVSREDLVNLFKSCGNVLGATLFKGYAFVQYSAAPEAELCVQTLNGYTWEGSELDVKLAFQTPPNKLKHKTTVEQSNTEYQTSLSSTSMTPSITLSAQTALDLYYKNKEFAKEIQRQLFESHCEGSLDDVLMCGECHFRTSDINDFADHRSRDCSSLTKPPPEPESVQCFTCDDTFATSWNLLQHLIDKHNLNLYNTDASEEAVETRGPRTPSPLPSEGVQSEQNVTNNEIQEAFENSPIKVETPLEDDEEIVS